jgi:hypothetical protein
MNPTGDEEQQRFLGFPLSLWPALEPGKGSPDQGEHRTGSTVARLGHPIAWVRWRIELRRRGPYAPDFNEFRRRSDPEAEAEAEAE